MEFKITNANIAFDILAKDSHSEQDHWKPTDLREDRLRTIKPVSYDHITLPPPLRSINARLRRIDGGVSMASLLMSRDPSCFRGITPLLKSKLHELNFKFCPTYNNGLGYISNAKGDAIITFMEYGEIEEGRLISIGEYGTMAIPFVDDTEDGSPNKEFISNIKSLEVLMGVYVDAALTNAKVKLDDDLPKRLYLSF